jgi:ABC-type dipeptide/oligopeptide/nickel transport system permease subunit
MGLFPSVLIAFITLGFTFMGDGLRDALDPTMNR